MLPNTACRRLRYARFAERLKPTLAASATCASMETRTKYLPILLLFVAASCQGGPMLPSVPPSPSSSTRISATSTPSVPRISPGAPLSTPTADGILHPIPSVACPSPAKVSLAGLGIPREIGILTKQSHGDANPVFLVSSSDPTPRLLFSRPSTSDAYYDLVGSSPDGRWLLIERVATSGEERRIEHWDLFIRSSNGQEEWPLGRVSYEGDFYSGLLTIAADGSLDPLSISGVKFGPSTGWLSNTEIVIYSQPMEAPSASEVFPAAVLDIFTRTAVTFFDTHDLTQAIRSSHYAGTYDVNRERLDVFIDWPDPHDATTYAFTFVARPTGLNGILFPWVNAADWMDSDLMAHLRSRVWQDSSDLFNLAVTQTFGLDLSLNLTFDDAASQGQYDDRMLSIAVPPGWGYSSPSSPIGLPNTRITWVSYDGHLLGVERQLHEGVRSFLLDTDTLQITEYCGDLPSVFVPFESPDGRFLLWNVESPASPNSVTSTVILDLPTGRYAILEGAEALGWLVIEVLAPSRETATSLTPGTMPPNNSLKPWEIARIPVKTSGTNGLRLTRRAAHPGRLALAAGSP